MALPILDGNQSATTLSSILTSGEHIPAHTVVSLGTQAITDMRGAVSGSVVSISNFPATQPVSIASVTIGNTVTIAGTVTANPTGTQTIAGTVTANLGEVSSIGGGEPPTKAVAIGFEQTDGGIFRAVDSSWPLPISGTVTIGSALPAGTNRIGVVTIGGGTVTIGAGTAQIGSVTVGNSVTIGSLPAISGTVTANVGNPSDIIGGGYSNLEEFAGSGGIPVNVVDGTVALGAGTAQIGSVTASISGTVPISISSVTVGNSVTIGSLPAISGTVTANLDANSPIIASQVEDGIKSYAEDLANAPFPISGTVTVGNTVTIAGTVTANPTGTQTIAGTVTAGNLPISPFAGVNAQLVNDESQCIGIDVPFQVSSWNNDNIPISGVVTVSNIQTVTLGSPLVNTTKYPTAFVGYDGVNGNWQAVPLSEYGACVIVGNSSGVFHASNPLPISGTVTANTFALQGTAVTTSNFTSTTASTVLANYNATREVLTIFNEGAGNLHICAGATCTTIAYQVRLSAGDYYEVPNHQTTITHSAVFATAGTARVTEVS